MLSHRRAVPPGETDTQARQTSLGFPTPGKGVDWWTLGCLIYEMVTGVGPFSHPDMTELLRMIVSSDPIYPSYISSDCAGCIKALMCREVDSRLGGGAELKEHAFFANLDWEALMRVELPAPWQPFGGPESPHPNTQGENRSALRDGFGTTWTSSVRNSTGSLAESSASSTKNGSASETEPTAAQAAQAGTAAQHVEMAPRWRRDGVEIAVWVVRACVPQPWLAWPPGAGYTGSSCRQPCRLLEWEMSRCGGAVPPPWPTWRRPAPQADNPMVGKKSTNLALALELTSEGSTWRVSNPLAELFGQASPAVSVSVSVSASITVVSVVSVVHASRTSQCVPP